MKRWTYCCDNHGEEMNIPCTSAFFEFLGDFRPHKRIHGGDFLNLDCLRRGASKTERSRGIRADVACGKEFVYAYSPDVMLLGNHDYRLWQLANENADGLLQEAGQDGVNELEAMFDTLGCTYFPYHARDGVYQQGDTKFLHGYHHGVYAAKRHAEVYGKCVVGHVHSFQQMPVKTMDGGYCQQVGCMCEVWQDYNTRQTNTLTHRNGWAFGYYNEKTGSNTIYTVMEQDGEYNWIGSDHGLD